MLHSTHKVFRSGPAPRVGLRSDLFWDAIDAKAFFNAGGLRGDYRLLLAIPPRA
jgi:hypothetical protein